MQINYYGYLARMTRYIFIIYINNLDFKSAARKKLNEKYQLILIVAGCKHKIIIFSVRIIPPKAVTVFDTSLSSLWVHPQCYNPGNSQGSSPCIYRPGNVWYRRSLQLHIWNRHLFQWFLRWLKRANLG